MICWTYGDFRELYNWNCAENFKKQQTLAFLIANKISQSTYQDTESLSVG